MNQESRKTGSSLTLHPCNLSDSCVPLFLIQIGSWIPGFLIVISVCLALGIASRLVAGDAVAVGYNSEGVWTAVTYYSSSTAKGGKDYKTEKEAQESALRDVRKRSEHQIATTSILASSDSTGFVAVARGQTKAGRDVNVVGRGETQNQADKEAFTQLNEAGAGAKQKIVYRYFSHGGASRTGD
jgi:hypothetical protein